MKPFLLELAEIIYATHPRELDKVLIIFPNRRATLYFRKHLMSLLERPVFSPSLVTIEEFIGSFSTFKVPDKLQLIYILQQVYNEVVSTSAHEQAEPFDQFYFWGEMLLRDFDETDKYLVEAGYLFRAVLSQKEIESGFDFLTDEQRKFLNDFWANFRERDSVHKTKFLETWKRLPLLYEKFNARLKELGFAYEGMLHRDVAEGINELYPRSKAKSGTRHIYFAGFNALTKAEEKIIGYFIRNENASIHWDLDEYYYNNNNQEAGIFFREYREHPLFAKSFPSNVPANFRSPKKVAMYGAPQPVGQAKIMAQVLHQKIGEGFKPEETLIVLPDEKLLIPVLQGVSGAVEKLNVTMGFSLGATPLFNFVELLMELQLNRRGDHFNHRAVVALFGHPYVVAADPSRAHQKRKEILRANWVNIPQSFLGAHVQLHRAIFQVPAVGTRGIIAYIKETIVEIGSLGSVTDFDKEYCFRFIRTLNRMETVFHSNEPVMHEDFRDDGREAAEREAIKSFLRLFRQLVRAEKIPFRGEPLKGLQVMGVLETRNMDFKNVFVLSLNEGVFPAFGGSGSYIPFNIRKAYGLPTMEQKDSMYAYLFYRVMQRAENVFLFYNSETDDLGQGEMSRYLQQLVFESGLPIEKYVLHNTLQPYPTKTITVEKNDYVLEKMNVFNTPEKRISPSALNDYIECRLKFYLKYVERAREADEVEEDLDARVLGNFVHKVMEKFYVGLRNKKGTDRVDKHDFDNVDDAIRLLIDQTFVETYRLDPEKKVTYRGQRLVVREMVERFVKRILSFDHHYAPFEILAIERRDLLLNFPLPFEKHRTITLSGSIDRADLKGDTVRIIDYKTGKDSLEIEDVASLFDRESERNKAAFQTLLYTKMFRDNLNGHRAHKFVPGLLNRNNVFRDDFLFGFNFADKRLEDAAPLMEEFDGRLQQLLEEIFNPSVPFDQTTKTSSCQYCPYHQLCDR